MEVEKKRTIQPQKSRIFWSMFETVIHKYKQECFSQSAAILLQIHPKAARREMLRSVRDIVLQTNMEYF